jgi:hypothetical protein
LEEKERKRGERLYGTMLLLKIGLVIPKVTLEKKEKEVKREKKRGKKSALIPL